MTEHSDKSPNKSGKTPPSKRAGKSRAPENKRATAPGERPGAPAAAEPAKSLAPDPATITFGSNRPIAAEPPKVPEGSGLRFSGPSDGVLKASGPQPSSPKASGLTFTSAKSSGSAAKPNGNGLHGKDKAKKPEPPKAETKKPEAKKPEAKKPEAKAPEAKKPEAKASETKKADAKKPASTKPAIAPQASGRRFDFDKERSTGGFVMVMLLLTVIGGGVAFWMKITGERSAPPPATVAATASQPAAPEAASAQTPVVLYGPSVRAPESPGPLAASTPPAGDVLSAEEIGEIQRLLARLDFDPGSDAGVLTEETAAAIRSYQEMAGLPADGEANRALLEELRSVADLYGS